MGRRESDAGGETNLESKSIDGNTGHQWERRISILIEVYKDVAKAPTLVFADARGSRSEAKQSGGRRREGRREWTMDGNELGGGR